VAFLALVSPYGSTPEAGVSFAGRTFAEILFQLFSNFLISCISNEII
jgi:hypothetical protein